MLFQDQSSYIKFYKQPSIQYLMDLEGSVDCDGSCSGLDLVGQRLVSHDECNRAFDDAISKLPSERYVGFMNKLQDNYPTIYRVAKILGF